MGDDDETRGGPSEVLIKLAWLVGMTPTQARWKLMRLGQWWEQFRFRQEQSVRHVRYEHLVCGRCGRVSDKAATRCSGCDAPLGSRAMQTLGRLGVVLPLPASVSGLLALLLVIVYVRLIAAAGTAMSFEAEMLARFGGNFPPFTFDGGQWWRLATAVFLHAGILHLGFNVFALLQVGPAIEEIFGRGVTLFLFMATGILASLGTSLLGLQGVSIGASGALTGLLGIGIGWGQRDGTSIGRETRNRMLKWGLYVILFGFMIGGADNGGHVSGLVAGIVLGYALDPLWLRAPEARGVAMALTLAGSALALATTLLCLFPPGIPGIAH